MAARNLKFASFENRFYFVLSRKTNFVTFREYFFNEVFKIRVKYCYWTYSSNPLPASEIPLEK